MSIALPPPLDTYFAAVNAHDAGIALCFGPDAVVHDEREDRIGRVAIRAWADETRRRYRHSVEVLACATAAERVSVTGRVSGDFPGSPIELRYDFTLSDGLIRRVEIG